MYDLKNKICYLYVIHLAINEHKCNLGLSFIYRNICQYISIIIIVISRCICDNVSFHYQNWCKLFTTKNERFLLQKSSKFLSFIVIRSKVTL